MRHHYPMDDCLDLLPSEVLLGLSIPIVITRTNCNLCVQRKCCYQDSFHILIGECEACYFHIKLWKRYIDDVLMIWSGEHTEAEAFCSWLNEQVPHLKFTHTIDNERLVFLDLNLFVENGSIKTNTHTKPTAINYF